jgi:hypothetical protein
MVISMKTAVFWVVAPIIFLNIIYTIFRFKGLKDCATDVT